jgi:hypothetical protein
MRRCACVQRAQAQAQAQAGNSVAASGFAAAAGLWLT